MMQLLQMSVDRLEDAADHLPSSSLVRKMNPEEGHLLTNSQSYSVRFPSMHVFETQVHIFRGMHASCTSTVVLRRRITDPGHRCGMERPDFYRLHTGLQRPAFGKKKWCVIESKQRLCIRHCYSKETFTSCRLSSPSQQG